MPTTSNLIEQINNVEYKPSLNKEVFRKYCTPVVNPWSLFGNYDFKNGDDWVAGDNVLDKTTNFMTRSLALIVGLSAVTLAVMGLFVGATYILSLSPVLGVTAGLGTSELGLVAGIASTLCLTGAAITAVPASVNGIVKSTGEER